MKKENPVARNLNTEKEIAREELNRKQERLGAELRYLKEVAALKMQVRRESARTKNAGKGCR